MSKLARLHLAHLLYTIFGIFFCKKWNEFKLNGFESLLFISNCVDINIVALHVMITIILREKKLYEKTNLQAVLAISIFDDVNLYQGKWWWAAMASISYQVWSYSLPLTPAPSLSCLMEGMATASPSCLGGGWSSVGDSMVTTGLTLASLGLQATPAGLTSTLWGASQ